MSILVSYSKTTSMSILGPIPRPFLCPYLVLFQDHFYAILGPIPRLLLCPYLVLFQDYFYAHTWSYSKTTSMPILGPIPRLLLCPYFYSVPDHLCLVCIYHCNSVSLLLTLGAHAQRGLRYFVCLSVCLSVCLLQLAWLTWRLNL